MGRHIDSAYVRVQGCSCELMTASEYHGRVTRIKWDYSRHLFDLISSLDIVRLLRFLSAFAARWFNHER